MLTLMLRICVEATFFVALITIDADITVNSKNSSFQIALQKISIAQIDPQWRVENMMLWQGMPCPYLLKNPMFKTFQYIEQGELIQSSFSGGYAEAAALDSVSIFHGIFRGIILDHKS